MTPTVDVRRKKQTYSDIYMKKTTLPTATAWRTHQVQNSYPKR